MAVKDITNVNGLNPPISLSFTDPAIRQKVLAKFQEMSRELTHIHQTMRTLEQAMRANVSPFGNGLAGVKKQLRDWVISLIESEGYIERMIGGIHAGQYFEISLAQRAARIGVDRARVDRAAWEAANPEAR